MDECIYAIHNNKLTHLFANINEIKSLEEIYRLIDVANNLRDQEIIWYIQEKKSRELPMFREEISEYISRKGSCSSCDPLTKLRKGLRSGNTDLIALSRDIITTPIDVRYLVGYSSEEYSNLLREKEEMQRKTSALLKKQPPPYCPISRNS